MATRERSPNYPGFGLPTAIDFITRVYNAERRSLVPVESLARALGALGDGVSGATRTKIAVMRQFGLLEVQNSKFRVSENAMALILHKEQDREFVAAAKEAALRPPIFAELFEQYGDASNDTLRIHLIKDKQFSEDGAKRLIKAFRDTLTFARLSGTDAEEFIDEAVPTTDAAPDANLAAIFGTAAVSVQGKGRLTALVDASVTTISLNWLLPDSVSASLRLAGGAPTKRAIERLIDYLNLMKLDLPEKTALDSVASE